MSEVVRYIKKSSEGRYVAYKYESGDCNSTLIMDKQIVGEPEKLLVVIIPD
ncbi:MAG: hypothetical protein ACXAAM_04050 [Candidatus Heimdallarchaeaceae archaeon]|jgi:hypothetical protein